MQQFNSEQLQEKWAPVLDYEGMEPIKDAHRRAVTAILLENQEREVQEERAFLSEAAPTTSTGSSGATAGFSASAGAPTAGFDPVLISLIRRSMPTLVAYDLAGVQPMNGPTGLIFAMRSKYSTMGGDEALFDEALTSFSGTDSTAATSEIGSGYVAGSDGAAVGVGTIAQGTSATEGNPGLLSPDSASIQCRTGYGYRGR